MAEELEVLWSKLSVTEEEGEGVELGSNSTRAAKEVGKNCAVLKILTHRSVSLDTLRKNLRMLWKTNKWVNFSELEAELFLVEFGDVKDKKKVLEMSPWSFEKQLVIIQEFEGELTPKEMDLKWSPFWIQIFNLPLMSRTKETGWAIGSSLGEVMEVDVPDSGVHWGKCLRVRVRIDATKRLIRGKRITIEGGESRWVQFKYERLPNFCYCCGLLSHVLKECPILPDKGRKEEESLQYGPWLRGDPYGRFQKEPGRYGGGETQGRRGVVAGGRLEWNHDQSDVPGEKTKVGENHVTEPAYFGSSSLPGIDATLEAPKQLTVTTHGSSKGEGAGVKSDFKTSIKIDSSPATYCTRSEVAEEMQWEKVQNQALRKAPSEVIPIPTSIISISPSVPDLSRSEDDIPPGFEGHHRNVVVGSKVLDKTEGYKGNCESLVQKYPEILSSPPKKSNGPTIGTTWANPSVGYSALDKQQDQPLILNSCVSHGPQLSDISNQHHTKHVSHVLGPKWSRVLRSPSDATVDMLIDPHSGWWNLNLLDQCFFPLDAKSIMSLPLCTTPQPDSLVWPAEKCGQFSVKSGYKCLCEDSQASDPVSEFPEVQRSLWKGIWKLNIPGKIKHFLWKSCTNSLPTKNNLLKRTIISEDVCHLCSMHPEDVMHALWGCSKVRQVWQRSFGWLDHNQVAEGSFSDLVRLVQTKPKMFPLFAVTAWAVWHHLNKSRLQVVSITLNRLATCVETYLQNYIAGHGQRLPPVRSVTGSY
nr:uncharacterized protein CFP56_14134 [Quercus suber]